ncbi:MAG: acyl-CoA thioesterase [Clostridiales bacterium]|jgi:acyl-CoA hydrolase|nr:acyl-CoA thioesterase [Clostridiales bacterium]
MSEKGKVRRESQSVMTELVLPNDANIIGNLLGGRLLHWIDIAGALAASRHAESIVATVIMDTVEFKHPVKVGNIVDIKSYVTWTGNTSIETAVEVYSENPYTGERHFVHKGYIVFVSIDKDGKKTPVIPYLPETPEEKAEFDEGAKRKAKRAAHTGKV